MFREEIPSIGGGVGGFSSIQFFLILGIFVSPKVKLISIFSDFGRILDSKVTLIARSRYH